MVDYIQRLPYEITELIVSYLNGNDILSCCQVCQDWRDVLDQECTWKLLCRQEKWQKDEESIDETWRELYWLNYNWRNGIYKCHNQQVPEGCCLQVGLDEELVILSQVLGTEIGKFGLKPTFYQSIYLGDIHFQTKTSEKRIVIKLRDSLHIFIRETSKNKNYRYNKIKTITIDPESSDYDPDLNLNSAIIQTGSEYLIVLQKEHERNKILVWNTSDGLKRKSLYLDDKVRHVFKIIISNYRLHLVILRDNEYKIKVYNFLTDSWAFEITAFKNVAFGVIPPELQVSDKLIVGFCPVNIDRDLRYGYSPLKVWDSEGKFINSIILNSGRIDYFAFCLSDDLIIYRHSETSIKVWKPVTDEDKCVFNVRSEIFKIDKSVGTLLVLSHDRYFEVWDYKDGKKLYTVKTSDDTHVAMQDTIMINKYYYAKQNRNKKSVAIFSFMHQSNKDENPLGENIFDSNFIMDNYTKKVACENRKTIL